MEFITRTEEETERVAEAFAACLKPGDIVAFHAPMGAGKTAFSRGIARGLGFKGRVTSPTYTIVNEYPSNPPLFHFDLYRLSDSDELYDIGFDEYLARGGICIIEWFENAQDVCNYDYEIAIDRMDDTTRRITIRKGIE